MKSNKKTLPKALVSLSFICLYMSTMVSCEAYKRQNKATKGAEIGVGAGAAAGAVIGKALGNTALGAILGGAVGGTAGVIIGKKMDKQAEEIKNSVPNATVERVGEGIAVKFDSGILFDIDKTALKPAALTNLDNFATSLKNNPDTKVEINGYTDNSGSEGHNLTLSEKRAAGVKAYLMEKGVDASRMTTTGYGTTHPAADNSSAENRAKNRRVEILIAANEKMKKEAQSAGK